MWTNEQKKVIATAALTNMFPGSHLDFWQEWYLCQNFNKIHLLKSRRVGFSFVSAIKAISEAVYPGIKRYQMVFLSYNLGDAMNKIRDAREALMNLPEGWTKPLRTDSKTALEFWDEGKKSVSQILSLPATSVRGFGTSNEHGGVMMDEGATIPYADRVYTAVLPSMSRGGKFAIGGTPEDQSGLFYDIKTDKEKYKSFKRIEIPWWWSSSLCTDVKTAIKVAPSLTTYERVETFGSENLKDIFLSLGLNEFKQEYELMFTSESDAFISLEMITACTPQEIQQYEYQDINEFLKGVALYDIPTGMNEAGEVVRSDVIAPAYDPEYHGILYAGWDMGRTKDASIFTLLGHKDGKDHVWMSYELKNKTFDEQKAFASLALSSLPIHQFLIDKNGLGMDFAEWAEKKFPTVAHGVQFTNESKEIMANKVYLGFERLEFVLPNNRKLQADIHCIRKTKTAMKFNKYDGSTKDSHADRFWSLALAKMGITEGDKNKSRFYSEYNKNKITKENKKFVSTGNRELDRIKRMARRGRRGR
jgi:phage FluMu gp28-like protein